MTLKSAPISIELNKILLLGYINRIHIMQNIGVVFVKMGQYSDAITSYEHIMLERPDYKTAFNLILCYYATGDRDKMKKTFMRLLQVDLNLDDEDKYLPHPVSMSTQVISPDVLDI